MLFVIVYVVRVGIIFLTPSSVAFSITKSVLSFFSGAKSSQISGVCL